MNDSFKYQKFREPEFNETFHHFFYEFYQHLENEFERLAEYILSKQNEVNNE